MPFNTGRPNCLNLDVWLACVRWQLFISSFIHLDLVWWFSDAIFVPLKELLGQNVQTFFSPYIAFKLTVQWIWNYAPMYLLSSPYLRPGTWVLTSGSAVQLIGLLFLVYLQGGQYPLVEFDWFTSREGSTNWLWFTYRLLTDYWFLPFCWFTLVYLVYEFYFLDMSDYGMVNYIKNILVCWNIDMHLNNSEVRKYLSLYNDLHISLKYS